MALMEEFMSNLLGLRKMNATSVKIVVDNATVLPTRRQIPVAYSRKNKGALQITMDNARLPTLKIRVQGRLAKNNDSSSSLSTTNKNLRTQAGLMGYRSPSYDTIKYSSFSNPSHQQRLDGRFSSGSNARWNSKSPVVSRRPVRPLSHDDIKKPERRWQSFRSSSCKDSSPLPGSQRSSSSRSNAVWDSNEFMMRPPCRTISPKKSPPEQKQSGTTTITVQSNDGKSMLKLGRGDDMNKGQDLVDTIRALSLKAAVALTQDGPCWVPHDEEDETSAVITTATERKNANGGNNGKLLLLEKVKKVSEAA